MKRTNTASWDEKNNRWRIAVQKNGIRKNFYSSTPGRNGQREANRKADEWLERNIVDPKINVETAYNDFLESRDGLVAYQNIRNQKLRFANHIKPIIGKKRVSDLDENDLQEVINTAFRASKLSEKTLKNIRGDLSAFLKFCRKRKYTTFLPEDIFIPSAASSNEKTILQPDDLKVLFSKDTTLYTGKEIKEEYIYAFRFQILTGLRPGELLGIKESDINYNAKTLNIQRSIDIDGKVTPGKNKNARRSVSLTPEAINLIQKQISDFGKTEYLFNIFSQKRYLLHLKRFCKSNGIAEVTPYELRHTFVSIAKTLPEGYVKSLVGHSQNMDTFGVYGHYLEGDKEKETELLSNVFDTIINK